MAVSAPTDKRFRRVHVSPRTRRRVRIDRRHLAYAALFTACMLYGGYRVVTLILSAEMLTVTRITVTGNAWLSRGEVLSMLDGLQGRNMLLVNLDEWRHRLQASPWVADVAIRRVLPGTVDVVVSERRPVGIARLGGTLYLIDERGRVIDAFGPNHANLDLPLIDGLAAPGPNRLHQPVLGGRSASADRPGGPPMPQAKVEGPALRDSSGSGLHGGGGSASPAIDEGRAELATRLLASLQAHPDLAARISQVDVTDVRDAAVMLKNDTALIRVGDDEFAERLRSYLDLAGALRERVPDIDYVDLRFGDRVYVRPQGPGPGARKAGGGS